MRTVRTITWVPTNPKGNVFKYALKCKILSSGKTLKDTYWLRLTHTEEESIVNRLIETFGKGNAFCDSNQRWTWNSAEEIVCFRDECDMILFIVVASG